MWLMQQRSRWEDFFIFFLLVLHSRKSVLPAAVSMLSSCCPNVQTRVQALVQPGPSVIMRMETPAGRGLVSDNLLARTYTLKHTHTHACSENSELLGQICVQSSKFI